MGAHIFLNATNANMAEEAMSSPSVTLRLPSGSLAWRMADAARVDTNIPRVTGELPAHNAFTECVHKLRSQSGSTKCVKNVPATYMQDPHSERLQIEKVTAYGLGAHTTE